MSGEEIFGPDVPHFKRRWLLRHLERMPLLHSCRSHWLLLQTQLSKRDPGRQIRKCRCISTLVPLPGTPGVQHQDRGSGVQPETTPAPHKNNLVPQNVADNGLFGLSCSNSFQAKGAVTGGQGKQCAIMLGGQ